MRMKLLSELLGGDSVKNCFIWPIASHTGTHLTRNFLRGVQDIMSQYISYRD